MTNEIITSGGKWTLLWTNPDLSADFPEQTIQLDLSQKKEIRVKIGLVSGDTSFVFYPCTVGGTQRATYWANFTSAKALSFSFRSIEADSNGVTFGDCYTKLTTATSTATKAPTYLRPRAIYAR